MRKLIVKIFNLVYLAGAVLAVVCLCTQPMFKTTVKVEMPGSKIAKLLEGIGGGGSSGGSGGESKAYTFDGEGSESSDNFSDKLTPEKIAAAFDAEGGFKLELTVSLEAKDAFNFKDNKTILQRSIVKTIDDAIGSVITSVTKPLNNLVKEIAKEYARDVMQDQINDALDAYKADETAEEIVSKDQVDALFDNVYSTLDTDNPVTVTDLENAILGKKDDGSYEEGGVYDLMQTLSDEGKIDLGGKTPEEILEADGVDFTDTMTSALENIPDLVYSEYPLADPQPTEAQFNEDLAKEESQREYYVKKGDKYVLLNEYDPTETYYKKTTYINNVDTALAQLLSAFLGGGEDEGGPLKGSRAVVRAEEGEKETKTTEEMLKESVSKLVYQMIPLEDITKATSSIDEYAGWAMLGIIGLFSFPWLLFGLVTLIRTLRRQKIWTKPWIVFVFAFLQLFFGLVLTYGTKYAIPLVGKYVPQANEYIDGMKLGLDLRTGCLVPSFVYLAFIPLTIAYIIVCHPLKVEYKLMKRERRRNR